MKKIYKLFVFAILLLIVLNANSQATYLAKLLPQDANRYLVLENNFPAGINYWNIEIIMNIYEDFEIVNQEVIENIVLAGINFYRIPEQYMEMENISVRITAYFQNDTYIVEENPISRHIPGGSNYFHLKDFTCLGHTYAYRLDVHKHKHTTEQYINIQPTAKFFNPVVYYYEYYPFSSWNNSLFNSLKFNDIPFWAFHGLSASAYSLYNQFDASENQVIKLQNPPTNGIFYKDGSGAAIFESEVFGVKKHLGPWCGHGLIFNNNLCVRTIGFHDVIVQDLQHAIALFNQHSGAQSCGFPVLTCDFLPNTNHFSGLEDQIESWLSGLNDDISDWGDISDWLDDLLEDLSQDGSVIKPESVSMHKLSGANQSILNMQVSDLYDENGSIITIPLQLEAGLYCSAVTYENGLILRTYNELELEYNPNNMSNNLNVTIYPVPILENTFYMNFQTFQDIDFEYTMYDFQGNPLYKSYFYIKEGLTENIQITPEEGIPYGYLVNVFLFPDGSQLSFLTLKQ